MKDDDLHIPVYGTNRDPRVACVLLADVSSSMIDEPIDQLQKGFVTFVEEVQADPLARKRAEIAVVTFGTEATLLVPFREARDLVPITFKIDGSTNLAAGIDLALDELERRVAAYKAEHLEFYRPWLFVLTDGAPNPGFEQALQRLNRAEAADHVSVFAVGVGEEVAWDTLNRLTPERPAMKLNGYNFREMFRWLSDSLSSVSHSSAHGPGDKKNSGEQVPLPAVVWGAAPA